MRDMKIKMFSEEYPSWLESTINEWLQEHKDYSIMNIQYSAVPRSGCVYYTAMVVYKEKSDAVGVTNYGIP